jgi:hypothetical protein
MATALVVRLLWRIGGCACCVGLEVAPVDLSSRLLPRLEMRRSYGSHAEDVVNPPSLR